MAEYCLKCFNKMNDLHLRPYHVKYFTDKDICEGCGKEKKLVCKFNTLGGIAFEIQSRRADAKEWKKKEKAKKQAKK